MAENPKLKLVDAADQLLVYGVVTSVNPETQTMSVYLSHVKKEILDIPIWNTVTPSGAGIRFMPIPKETYIILAVINGLYRHVGYILDDMSLVTDDSKSSKKSGVLLQRFLEPGEIQVISKGQGEILLSNDGSILISSGVNSFIKLDSKNLALEALASTAKIDTSKVKIRSGIIKRPGTDTNRDVVVVDNNNTLQEFTVSVGVTLGSDTGLPLVEKDATTHVSLYPTVATLSIADKVYNEASTVEELNSKFLQGLLRFRSGISFNVDQDGTFTILDETNNNYIKWTVGVNGSNNLTSYEMKINDTYITVTSDNSYTIRNAHSTITSTSAGAVIVEGDASITIQSGSANVQQTLLGNNTFNYINNFITAIFNAHVHPTGVGPSGPPTPLGVAPVETQLLSAQVKNN